MICTRLAVLFDQLAIELDCDYLRGDHSLICRMIFQSSIELHGTMISQKSDVWKICQFGDRVVGML